MYKLKNENGRVNCLLHTGKDFVRNNLPVAAAQHIIDYGELMESDKPEYPICVDNKWYFEGENPIEHCLQAPKPKRKGGHKV